MPLRLLCQPVHQYESPNSVEVGCVVRDQRQAVAERDAGDLQVEFGEGHAGPAEVVPKFGVTASRSGIERQNRNDLKKFIHEGKIFSQTLGSVRAKHKLAHRHCGDEK